MTGNPTKDTLEKIAAALNVPVTELFEQPKSDTINCPHCGGVIKVGKG
jgi:transcriptional regulator with XRE-family HTH domain